MSIEYNFIDTNNHMNSNNNNNNLVVLENLNDDEIVHDLIVRYVYTV